MAQSGFTPISIYYSTTASAVPTAANLVPGELAINTNDGKLYYEDSSGVVRVLASKSTGTVGGSNTQVQFNNSGSLGGSSGLTWDGSFLTTSSIKNSALTSGRVTYAGASGLLSDSANFVFNGTSLGVGTASPVSKVSIVGGNGDQFLLDNTGQTFTQMDFKNNGTTKGIFWWDNTNTRLVSYSTASIGFAIGGNVNPAMTLDSSGNLGLGVTPSASDSVFKVLDVGQAGNGISGNSGTTQLTQGVYYNSGYKYSVSSTAVGRYEINTGVHKWNIAPSGTAGNAISFTQAMTLDASGNLFVNCTTTPSASVAGVQMCNPAGTACKISAGTATSFVSYLEFINGNGLIGSISGSGSLTSYNVTSDYRLKENIAPMTGALAKVAQLKPVTYKWKVNGSDGQGFIAHELQAVVPDCVTGEKDATKEEEYEITPAITDDMGKIITPAQKGTRTVPVYQGVDTSFLVATLVSAIQELKAEFDAYKATHP